MRVSAISMLAVLGFAVSASAVAGLRIDHAAVGCIVAERYPRIEASIEPSDSVARARVYFRAAGTADWYFVEMKRESGTFQATLPKPQKATQAVDYYVQALDTAFAESLTPEHKPVVATEAGGCRKDMTVAVALTTAKVTLGAAAGAPAIPAGFASAGVATVSGSAAAAGGAAAGGGGISTGVLVGVLGAGAAAAGAAVAAGGGGGGDEPTTSSGPPVSNIEIHGEVSATFGVNPANPTGPGLYGAPVAGAVVTTTLDGSSTTTDGSGRFALVTRTASSVGCRVSTLTIVAAGHPTYSMSGHWNNNASNAVRFSLSPPMPASWPGCP